jgi:tRNA-splicing ligase RtcB
MTNEVWDLGDGALVKAWTRGVQVEDQARAQLENIARMPFIHKWVAAMPDVHLGIGATVGSVIATKRAIIPAAVGVDIGCGMMAVRTNLSAGDLPDSLAAMRSEIERVVPHGRTNNGGPGDRGAWHNVPVDISYQWAEMAEDYQRIVGKNPGVGMRGGRGGADQLGTLGGGNHFIEVCLDKEQRVWIMLHSGSRGLGNKIGMYFIEKAKEEMERWLIRLPDRDLAYLPQGTSLFDDYVEAVHFAQRYAMKNRVQMMKAVAGAVGRSVGQPVVSGEAAVNCHHNYVEWENHYGENVLVTRKGAVRAREGDLGIIPGSMGARSFIVRGKGNPESFNSCSHGAGRMMSRTEARKRFTLEDHAIATAGVECKKDASVLDETPGAYKPIDDVMAAQSDLVEIVHELSQVLCVKG